VVILRRIPGYKMRNHNFYCSEELWEKLRKFAAEINMSDSEYIRRAIEHYNFWVDTNTQQDAGFKGIINIPKALEEFEQEQRKPASIIAGEETAKKAQELCKTDKLEAVLSKPPEYPKPADKPLSKGYCNPIPKGK
jgi:hypothetical protein